MVVGLKYVSSQMAFCGLYVVCMWFVNRQNRPRRHKAIVIPPFKA